MEEKKKLFIEEVLKTAYLNDNFNLKKKTPLGEGGFGSVLLVPDKTKGIPYAIKILFPTDSSLQERMKELSILLTLNEGPHVVKIENHYSDSFKGHIIIVMEKGDASLSSLIKKQGPLNPEELSQMIVDVTSALYFAQQKGIIHSDIKPANIIAFDVDRDSIKEAQRIYAPNKKRIYKLADWGSGHYMGLKANKTTFVNTEVGYTLSFVAPEIHSEKKEINFSKCDIYSLGLTILVACGALPANFQHWSLIEKAKKHENEVNEILDDLHIITKYGSKIKDLIEKMVYFDHNNRPDCLEILNKFKENPPTTKLDDIISFSEKKMLVKTVVHGIYRFHDELQQKGGSNIPILSKCFDKQLEENYEFIHWASENLNFDEAHVLLGRMHYFGLSSLSKNEETSLEYYQKAHDLGNSWGTFGVGIYYDFVKNDLKEAFRFYELAEKKAVEKGTHCWSALNNMGNLYEIGEGVPQNVEKAQKLYELCVAAGNSTAKANLGKLLIAKNGRKLIEDSAREGNSLGWDYLQELIKYEKN